MKTRWLLAGLVSICGIGGCSFWRPACPPGEAVYAPAGPAIGYLPPSALTPSCASSGPVLAAAATQPPATPALSPPQDVRFYNPPPDKDWHPPTTPSLQLPNSG